MKRASGLSRRSFFKLVGGGIVVFVGLAQQEVLSQPGARLYPEDFNAYLVIRDDGRVTVFSGKIEMGQGVLTSQAQMVAEELGVALAAIDMVLGDTDRCPWDMGTFGSLTTRVFGPALRAAGCRPANCWCRWRPSGWACPASGCASARVSCRWQANRIAVSALASSRAGCGWPRQSA
jgi:isoquinoline 1-oxidoreductase